jgi:type I restriction enzyme, S subunit
MGRRKLSELIEIISGGTPKTSIKEFWGGDIGWLSVTDFNNDQRFVYSTEKTITKAGVENSSTKFLRKGDVIISARGTVGALAQIGTPLCFNQSCFGLRGKRGVVDNDFLYYSLKNYVKNIVKRSQGSVFDTINLKSFDLMQIDIPESITQQKKIAKILSDLDSKIELNNKINEELESMAKLIYDYWFVQFDFPDENGKPYKSSGGKMVYNEELKKEIPIGFEVKTISSFVKLASGYSFKSQDYLEKGSQKIITIKNVQDGYLDLTKTNFIDKIPDGIPTYCVLEIGDILISLTGNVGRMCRVYQDNCLLNQRVGKFSGDKNYFNYVYLFLSRREERVNLEKISSGSAQKNLSPVNAMKRKMAIPSHPLLSIFNEYVTPIFYKQLANNIENQKLLELRDWLLPMLMNGQVTIKD